MNAAKLPFNTLRNFVCRLVIYRLCSWIFFSWTKLRRKIALCSSELSLNMPWNFMRTFKRTFIEKSQEQRTKFTHFAHITFAQYCMSSVASLYFFNSFLVGIILWRTLKENCLSLLSLDDSYISLKLLFQSVKYRNNFSKTLLRLALCYSFQWTFYSSLCNAFWVTVMLCRLTAGIRKEYQTNQELGKPKLSSSALEGWQQVAESN